MNKLIDTISKILSGIACIHMLILRVLPFWHYIFPPLGGTKKWSFYYCISYAH